MIKSTPYEYLKKFVSIDKSVGLFPVIILDNAIDIYRLHEWAFLC